MNGHPQPAQTPHPCFHEDGEVSRHLSTGDRAAPSPVSRSRQGCRPGMPAMRQEQRGAACLTGVYPLLTRGGSVRSTHDRACCIVQTGPDQKLEAAGSPYARRASVRRPRRPGSSSGAARVVQSSSLHAHRRCLEPRECGGTEGDGPESSPIATVDRDYRLRSRSGDVRSGRSSWAHRLARAPPAATGHEIRQSVVISESRACRFSILQRNAATR